MKHESVDDERDDSCGGFSAGGSLNRCVKDTHTHTHIYIYISYIYNYIYNI